MQVLHCSEHSKQENAASVQATRGNIPNHLQNCEFFRDKSLDSTPPPTPQDSLVLRRLTGHTVDHAPKNTPELWTVQGLFSFIGQRTNHMCNEKCYLCEEDESVLRDCF
jgi:hypothetical protein